MKVSKKFEQVKTLVRDRIPDLVTAWLPGGRQQGNYWVCGNIRGDEGTSLHVSLIDGHFLDHADSSVRGGDIISLLATIKAISQSEAADTLLKDVGGSPAPKRVVTNKTIEIRAIPAPVDVDLPTFGPNDIIYQYHNADGQLLFLVIRTPEKKFFQYIFDEVRNNWAPGGWSDIRPLFRLGSLLADAGLPVCVVEGEKSAAAAVKFFSGTHAVVSWSGGANAWQKSDWTPLVSRRVVIWPDNDQPGMLAGIGIAKALQSLGCSAVSVMHPPSNAPQGWDAHDALVEGFTVEQFLDLKRTSFNSAVIAEQVTPSVIMARHAQLVTNKSGVPIPSVANCVQIFIDDSDYMGKVWYDTFYCMKRKAGGGNWTDDDTIKALIEIQRTYKLHSLTISNLRTAIDGYAIQKAISAPLEWMKGLVWDGKPRIANLFHHYFGADDTEYVKAASHNFMVSIAARIASPGSKVDTMPVLEGAQGKRKSTALMVLAGEDWHCDQVADVNDKDFFQALTGKLIVEIAELDSFKRGDVTRIKQVLSIQVDHYRPSYGHDVLDRPRQCVFVGTTNRTDYLVDDTGNRRFWPIKTGEILIDEIRKDREQLFAEAFDRFNNGSTWWEMPGNTKEIQASRVADDSWTDTVLSYVATIQQTSTAHILSAALGIDIGRQTKIDQMRVASIMRRAGWDQMRQTHGEHRARVWWRGSY